MLINCNTDVCYNLRKYNNNVPAPIARNDFQALLENYRKQQKGKNKKPLLTLVNLKRDSSRSTFIAQIKILGNPIVFECSPQKIVLNNQLLNEFSKKAICMLAYIAMIDITKDKNQIFSQKFDPETNKTIFNLGMEGSPITIKKTASEVSLDLDLLTSLNVKDAHLIGFNLAYEQMLAEKKEILLLEESMLKK